MCAQHETESANVGPVVEEEEAPSVRECDGECGESFPVDELQFRAGWLWSGAGATFTSGRYFCHSCAGECESCARFVENEDSIFLDGERHCMDCCFSCERCGVERLNDDGCSVQTTRRHSETWCESCRDRFAFWCDGCQEYHTFDNYGGEQERTGDYMCSDCFSEVHVSTHIGDYHSRTRRNATVEIHSDWSKRHGCRLFGVELEVEVKANGGASRADLARGILEAVNADGESQRLWAEHDGSLVNGFELISAPMGLDLQRDLWTRTLARPEIVKLRSHDTTTCGLHVHVSRTGLTQLQIAKAIVAINDSRFEELVWCVARRYGSSYCEKRDGCKLSRRTIREQGRYVMLNTLPTETVEFRLFRGSLRLETVLACIEFAHAFLGWCRDTGNQDLTPQSFVRWIHDANNRADTGALRALIDRRAGRIGGAFERWAAAPYRRPAAVPVGPLAISPTFFEE